MNRLKFQGELQAAIKFALERNREDLVKTLAIAKDSQTTYRECLDCFGAAAEDFIAENMTEHPGDNRR